MISKGSRDIEDRSKTAENHHNHHTSEKILKLKIVVLNCKNMSHITVLLCF